MKEVWRKNIEYLTLSVVGEGGDRYAAAETIRRFDADERQELLAFLGRHGLLPIFYNRFSELKLKDVPAEFSSELENSYAANLVRNLTVERETVNVLKRFKEAGIEALPLKGPLMARYIYGDAALRKASGDVDLLVKPERLSEVEDFLKRDGWISRDEPKGEFAWRFKLKYTRQLCFSRKTTNTLGMLALDLHTDICESFMFSAVEDFWRNSREVDIDGVKVIMPSNEDLLVYLGLLCMSIKEFLEMRYFYDLYVFASRYKNDIDWGKVAGNAAYTRHRNAVFFSLKISQEIFGLVLPAGFLENVRPNAVKEFIFRLWINKNSVLYRAYHKSYRWYIFFTTWRYFAASLFYSNGIFDCVRMVRDKIFLPKEEMEGFFNCRPSRMSRFLCNVKRILKPVTYLFRKSH